MSYISSGKCQCGQVIFSVVLPKCLEKYSPVKCDCDFCTEHNISYLSHPAGTLNIECREPFEVIRQGSDQAIFLTCGRCGTVVAAVHQFDPCLKGTVNAGLLTESERLQQPIIVSPRLLGPQEKLSTWQSVWLRVRVNGNDHLYTRDH